MAVACKNSLDCPNNQVCDIATHQCVACLTDADCGSGQQCVAQICRGACVSDKDCTPLGELCDRAAGSLRDLLLLDSMRSRSVLQQGLLRSRCLRSRHVALRRKYSGRLQRGRQPDLGSGRMQAESELRTARKLRLLP